MQSIHPLELCLGLEIGFATPALAERIGRWAADHSQGQVLEMLAHDPVGACTPTGIAAFLFCAFTAHREYP